MTDQAELLRRAEQVLPGGILGSHRSGPGLEFVVKEGRGAYLWDMNGRRYLDYLLGSGPMLLGQPIRPSSRPSSARCRAGRPTSS